MLKWNKNKNASNRPFARTFHISEAYGKLQPTKMQLKQAKPPTTNGYWKHTPHSTKPWTEERTTQKVEGKRHETGDIQMEKTIF